MNSMYTTLLLFCSVGAIYADIIGDSYGLIKPVESRKPEGCKKQSVPHGRVTEKLPKGKRFFSTGQTLSVECLGGYVRTGPRIAECLAGGVWSVVLQCSSRQKKLSICKMTELKLGYYLPMKKAYGPGEVITWHCNENNYLEGSATSECGKNGHFAPKKPTCIPKAGEDSKHPKPFIPHGPGSYVPGKYTCQLPDPPINGRITIVNGQSGSSIQQIGQEIKYVCDKGFRLKGSERSTCRQTFGFVPNPPTCKRVECQFTPLKPQYGDYVDLRTEYYYGDKVEYVCDEHYTMIGVDWAICREDGQFSSGPPMCRAPTCKFDCKKVKIRTICQCDKLCVVRKDCCDDFDQHCRKLFY